MWPHEEDDDRIAQAPRRTVGPVALPVTAAEATGGKAHMRVDGTDQDAMITAYLEAATAHLDGYRGVLGAAIMRQTWAQSMSRFPRGRRIRFPVGPVAAKADVTVTYFDRDGASQTLSADDWHLVTLADGAHVELAANAHWPATAERPDAVTVTAVCGYATAADVPAPIKQAIRLIASLWNEQREAGSAVNMSEIPFGARDLIAPLRRIGV